MTPISRVFSTTIIEKIARMPNPATAMMKNSRMFRILCSIATAPSSGPCFCSQVVDAEEHRLELVERVLDLLGHLSQVDARLDLDLDLVDRAAAVERRAAAAGPASARAARRRGSSRTRSSRS